MCMTKKIICKQICTANIVGSPRSEFTCPISCTLNNIFRYIWELHSSDSIYTGMICILSLLYHSDHSHSIILDQRPPLAVTAEFYEVLSVSISVSHLSYWQFLIHYFHFHYSKFDPTPEEKVIIHRLQSALGRVLDDDDDDEDNKSTYISHFACTFQFVVYIFISKKFIACLNMVLTNIWQLVLR